MQFKIYKFRLYPTQDQKSKLTGWFGQTRWLWNHFLDQQHKKYTAEKKFLFRLELQAQVPFLKKQHAWLDAPAHSLQAVCANIDLAIRRSTQLKLGGFPKFKNRQTDYTGLHIPQVVQKHINWNKQHIQIPKLGTVSWKRHRIPQGKFTSLTVKTTPTGKWWVCMLFRQDEIEKRNSFTENEVVGLDLGLKTLITTSSGEFISNPKFARKHHKKLRSKQRKLSHKTIKTSKRRNKSMQSLARCHEHITNCRNDYSNKTVSQITKKYPVVIMENLAIKNMIKNRCLSRSIADAGWGLLVNKFRHKAKLFHQIPTFFASSKTCSCCGHKQEIALSQRTYLCPNCGHLIDRDVNAAINIRNLGIQQINTGGKPEIYVQGDVQHAQIGMTSNTNIETSMNCKCGTSGSSLLIILEQVQDALTDLESG